MGKKKHALETADLIRIPGGIFFIVLAIQGGRKSIAAFAPGVVEILVAFTGLAVSIIFLAIGLVMALGWIGTGRQRR